MGHPRLHSPALLLLAAFSRYETALDWARDRAIETWGAVARESLRFEFTQTDYYLAEMGRDCERPFGPSPNRWIPRSCRGSSCSPTSGKRNTRRRPERPSHGR